MKITHIVKKKILIGITLSEIGGSQKVVFSTIKALPEEEFEITLLTAPHGELLSWIEQENQIRNIKIKVITKDCMKRNISPINDLVMFIWLILHMVKEKYQIAHFHNSKIGVLGRLAAKIARVPKIYYTVHGWGINNVKSPMAKSISILLEKIASWVSTQIICVSQNDLNEGVKHKLIKRYKSLVIYNGIKKDCEMINIREKLHLNDQIPIVLSIMRLSHPKEPVFTIKVAKRLRDMGCIFRLVIVGDGPLKDECLHTIIKYELDNYVTLLGASDNARSLLDKADLFILFSRWEGLPISILEAMFAAKPVIASNVGGICEEIIHGWNGNLISGFDDADEMLAASYIYDLLTNPDLYHYMSMNTLLRAEEMFKEADMTTKYLDIYRETNCAVDKRLGTNNNYQIESSDMIY